MMYYCGWDGGGTKTSVCITDPCGEVLAEGAFGPVNPNGTETEVVQSTVRDCISFMASQPGGLDAYGGLVVGFAGVSNHKAVALIENAIRGGGFHGNLLLIGDHEIALAGALEGPGAILIAGTGSICFCRNTEGKTYRSGGYGYLIDDEGSGYALGRDILSAVVRAADGRGPATILTQVVYQQLQIHSLKELVTWLYAPDNNKKQVAGLAPLLIRAINEEDCAARMIAEKASCELTALVVSAMDQAGIEQGKVALMGSILDHFTSIREMTTILIRQKLPHVQVGAPLHNAAWGAAKLARETFQPEL